MRLVSSRFTPSVGRPLDSSSAFICAVVMLEGLISVLVSQLTATLSLLSSVSSFTTNASSASAGSCSFSRPAGARQLLQGHQHDTQR